LLSSCYKFHDLAVQGWLGILPTAKLLPLPASPLDECTTVGSGGVNVQMYLIVNLLDYDAVAKRFSLPGNILKRWFLQAGDGMTQMRNNGFRTLLQKLSAAYSFKEY
jgi:hypothetical protein